MRLGALGRGDKEGETTTRGGVGYVGTMLGFVRLLIIFCSSGSVTFQDKLSNLEAPTQCLAYT